MQVTHFDATFIVDGKTLTFKKVPMRRAGTRRHGGFVLTTTTGEWTGLRLRRAAGKKPFDLQKVTYDISFPLTNAAKIIVPDTGRHFMNTLFPRQVMFKWEGYFVSSAHMSTPCFIYLDGLEKVSLAFGLMGKTIDTVFQQKSPGANEKFSLVVYDNECRWQIRKPYHENASLGPRTEWVDGFYQSEGDKSWFHALRRYAGTWQREHKVKLRTNRAIHTPEFCTWRVVNSDKLTHDWTVRTARECRKLGLGAMILDDGWFGVGLDSTIMESSLGNWPRTVPGKYPDITRTIQAIKKEGVAPLLWYCPTGIGPQSDLYKKALPYCIVNEGKRYMTPGLFHTLCPRNPQARKLMVQNLRKVLSYKPAGYKPDLFNYMPTSPCEADHEHDIPTVLEATRVCFQMMNEEAMRHGPEVMFMAKNDEANIDFCQYAPAVRAGDSPYDPNIMFLRCAYPNAFAPAVINDYLMLAGPETDEEIARCMIKQVTLGVPAMSIDLLNTPQRQKNVLAAWLGLYNRELIDLHMAARVEPQDSALTCWERIDRRRKMGVISVVHPGCAIEQLPDVKRLLVLNATANEELAVRESLWRGGARRRAFDCRHKLLSDSVWDGADAALPVPPSGYVELTRT